MLSAKVWSDSCIDECRWFRIIAVLTFIYSMTNIGYFIWKYNKVLIVYISSSSYKRGETQGYF